MGFTIPLKSLRVIIMPNEILPNMDEIEAFNIGQNSRDIIWMATEEGITNVNMTVDLHKKIILR